MKSIKNILTKNLALQHLKNELCLQALQIEKIPSCSKNPAARLNIIGIAVGHLDQQMNNLQDLKK
ncbi:hypothetical protein [Persicobacter diffluens]|uniref:Uncharacterized protein n=1 Tax=Persicobacter diffluens TaxID=981 RepID=A0AAN5AN78_9BACT|nr:hypothetical protein PEDI_31300 [Persicobacter diffluens]